MNFGLHLSFRNPPAWYKPFPRLYGEYLEWIAYAEELGFNSVWISEHHFTEDGYSPSFFPLATAIAMRTKRMRIGSYVLLLPLHHAVQAAEDAAVLDNLSNGRLILGLGLGYAQHDYAGYGVDLKDRGSLGDEGVQVIRGAWTQEGFSFSGRHYHVQNIRLSPKPVQKPHPPIYMAGMTAVALKRAARLGADGLAGVTRDPQAFQVFVDALKAQGKDARQVPAATLMFMYTGEDGEQAWRDIRPHAEWEYQQYRSWGAMANRGQELPRDYYIVGDPTYCIQRIEERLAVNPLARIETMAVHLRFAGVDHKKVMRATEVFAKHVIPHFKNR